MSKVYPIEDDVPLPPDEDEKKPEKDGYSTTKENVITKTIWLISWFKCWI
ncbi:hypothetical protein [Pseudomonas sp. MWU16-30322]|nr:hypothetical protein [Pseudomonas sp. MWU16-30322]